MRHLRQTWVNPLKEQFKKVPLSELLEDKVLKDLLEKPLGEKYFDVPHKAEKVLHLQWDGDKDLNVAQSYLRMMR